MNNQGTILLGIFLIILAVILTFSFSTNNSWHEIMHGVILMMSLYLSFLSFKAHYKYKISRLLFTGFAFAVFAISEVIEMIDDINDSGYEELSISDIGDYIVFAAIALFAIGTVYKTKITKYKEID